jgi:hypothetical protein
MAETNSDNMFSEQADLDRRAAALSPQSTRRGEPDRPKSAYELAAERQRGYRPPGEDPIEAAKRGTEPPAPSEPKPAPPESRGRAREVEIPNPLPPNWRADAPTPEPPPAVDTRQNPWLQKPGGAKFGGETHGGYQTGPQYGPRPEDPRARAAGAGVAGGAAGPAVGDQDTDRAGAAGLNVGDPYPPQQADRAGAAGLNVGDPYPTRETGAPSVTSDDEASFRPGPLPKRAGVTPAGKGGGGGGGRGGRKQLGDQTRVEAYDPELDKMDPRNIGVIDTEGRNKGQVNRQVYAASPMTHPEAYGKGEDQFTKGRTITTSALKGATEFVADQFHQNTPDAHTAEGYHALTFGKAGAPDDDTMRSVFAVVDPNNQLDYKHRLELATKTGYDWYMHNGQPEKAKKFAADALQYGNAKAQTYGNAAIEEMKAGNRDGAIKHLQTGYGWLPDGYHADPTADGKTMEIHDGKGNVVQKIPLDDKTVQNLAVGMATGTLYWDTVQHRAGVEKPFRPQPQPPNQAVSTQPPQPAAAAPAPSPGARPPGAPGAAAPVAAPAAAAPPPVAAPAGTPPPQPLPTPAIAGPQFNTPSGAAAPAPAAPGPAPPTQAITPQPPAPPPPAPAATPAAAAPPAIPGPVQPSTTKRPIVNEPPPGETKPPTPPQPKAGEPPPDQKPQVTLARPNNDPDAVPTHITDGKNSQPLEPYRRTSVAQTEMVTRAREAVEQADQQLARQRAWITSEIAKLPGGKAGAADRATLASYAKQAENDHSATVARHREVLQNWENQRREQDNFERTELKPQPLHETDRAKAEGKIDKVFEQVAANKDKPGAANSPNLYNNSPLRLEDKEGSRKEELKQLAIKLIEHNPDITPENAARYIVTMTSHIGDDENAKKASLNGATGEKGSRFRVENQDLRKQAVVAVVDGQNVTRLHIPKNVLAEIQRFKRESYGVDAEKVKEAKGKAASEKAAADLKKEQEARGERTGAGAFVPEATRQSEEAWKKDPVGSAVTEIAGAYAKFGTPAGWTYLVGKYGENAARQAFEKLGKRIPEVEATPEPGRGQPVLPAPGT